MIVSCSYIYIHTHTHTRLVESLDSPVGDPRISCDSGAAGTYTSELEVLDTASESS